MNRAAASVDILTTIHTSITCQSLHLLLLMLLLLYHRKSLLLLLISLPYPLQFVDTTIGTGGHEYLPAAITSIVAAIP